MIVLTAVLWPVIRFVTGYSSPYESLPEVKRKSEFCLYMKPDLRHLPHLLVIIYIVNECLLQMHPPTCASQLV